MGRTKHVEATPLEIGPISPLHTRIRLLGGACEAECVIVRVTLKGSRSARILNPSRSEAKEKVAALATYLQNNLDRMDYPTYRREGLRIGSGTVESANYHVTGARLKLQGMRWAERGARDMALLRADLY